MTTASITIQQDSANHDLFHVTGPRLNGTVTVQTGLHTDRWHEMGTGSREVTVGTVRVLTRDLTVNGVALVGDQTYRAVSSDYATAGTMIGGHLNRADNGKVSDAARDTFRHLAQQVTSFYAITHPELTADATVAEAERKLDDAMTDLIAAKAAVQAAGANLAAVKAASNA